MCPRINLNHKPKKNNREKELAQKLVYNTPTWKALRLNKLQIQPLCEECIKNNKITLAVEVHHIQKFMSGMNVSQIKWLGFDINNLMSLCIECHQCKHKKT